MMNEYQQKATDALVSPSGRIATIVSNSTPEGLVEQSVRLCRQFDCNETGLDAAIEVAREYANPVTPLPPATSGVGTELSKLIPEWATVNSKKCKCKDFANKMDRWGIEGCIGRRDIIIAHLIAQDEHLVPVLRLIPESIKRVTAGKLLRQAIANAKK